MKFVIAPDSFKGSLSSVEVADAIECGIKAAMPESEVVKLPLADGGEGTMRVLVEAMGGDVVQCVARDPLERLIKAEYGIVERGEARTAIIEMAEASGLLKVVENERDAMRATTVGTGDMIKDALNRECRNFLVCIGGSATTDAGKGMLEALGCEFRDCGGYELAQGGGSLIDLCSICSDNIDARLRECDFTVACDVRNPLYGKSGAAFVFAPQKGASIADAHRLDMGLRKYAECVHVATGVDVAGIEGGGAAGGLGAAFVAFLGATIRSGVDVVLDAAGFDECLCGADMVITGEGKADVQTLMGKLPMGVLRRSVVKHVPVVLMAGCVENRDKLLDAGFAEALCVNAEHDVDGMMMLREVAMARVSEAVKCYLNDFGRFGQKILL